MPIKIENKIEKEKERVYLVVLDFKDQQENWTIEQTAEELEELAISCRALVVDSMICTVAKPTAKYLIGSGKVDEIKMFCATNDIDTVIFSHDLKGSQQRNIEDEINCKTIDRTQLILDIFVRNATSKEGQMQVELAQLEYLLPRLVGKGIELSRLGGGIGTLGPGETKLEVDRRRISQRISKLKKDLQGVTANRELNRKKRQDKQMPSLSLVGYTNAGKSTLLNTLTDAKQKTKDGLFTTLDSLARQLTLSNHQQVIISDTVGFMHELPHRLIEAFKATLEEVNQADILLHVLDISHTNFRGLYDSVNLVLKELNVVGKPTIVVLNKVDKLDDPSWLKEFQTHFEHAVVISAKNKINIDGLLAKIQQMLSVLYEEIDVDLPLNRMDLVNLAHEKGEVVSIKYYNDRINLRVSIPSNLAGRFKNLKK